jgi:hypothetical protein
MFLNGPIINEMYMTQPKGKEFWVASMAFAKLLEHGMAKLLLA